ncbi:hypothetical protein BJP37_11155 [Moorena bouillonii PNG]|uniref:Uncharacterized protein n=1 Tax=Moorena bouillonii PNG TaxID=568701 RepID=A0A1U7N0M9_9CYAN|nr:hypothetical protein BJP37_11155 [Moorena bouillonii PNG]
MGDRESGVGSGATRGEFNSPTESAPRESGVGSVGGLGRVRGKKPEVGRTGVKETERKRTGMVSTQIFPKLPTNR